jgi:hypothetical protein
VLNNLIFLKNWFLSINYIHNQFQNIQWISSKVLEWKFIFFRFFFLGQNLLKNDFSIHRICPQSGLKHSVDHFQGIGMNIMHIVMVIYLTHQWLLRLDFIRFSHLSFLVLSTGPPSCPCFTIVSLPLWICMWFPRCLSWL